jgi:hypothetical protein
MEIIPIDMIPTFHREVKDSPRRRHLDGWKLIHMLGNDKTTQMWKLQGWTVQEADGSKPPARFTVTSPIIACEGDIAVTVSGSLYKLLTPAETQTIYSQDQYIADEFLNAWIDGDNWLTI